MFECSFLTFAQASRRLKAHFDRHLSTASISSTQFTILSELLKQPGIGMLELSESVAIDRTSLVRAIQPLVRRGYIVQIKDSRYNRRYSLYLSAEGRTKCEEAAACWDQAENSLGFSASDATLSDFCMALAHVASASKVE